MPAKKKPTPKKRPLKSASVPAPGVLFDRVVSIMEQARANVVRAVNSNMVLAYWLIGREIVQEIQGGKERAAYGQKLLRDLSQRLTERFGNGFSITSLKYFRTFYQAYEHRLEPKGRPLGDQFSSPLILPSKGRPVGDPLAALAVTTAIPRPVGAELQGLTKSYPTGSEFVSGLFSPQLNWSHYRALMRVENVEARDFYEQEAIAGGWDKRTLERQIHSFYFERLLKSQHPEKMLTEGRQTLASPDPAIATLKHPYVLEFLGLPEVSSLNEEEVESAILSYLQSFLLELGKGFAFVARQKRLRIDDDDRYVDLVFYHIQSRFYLLIDLKIGKLTHQDVGQMDGYVRIFDDQCLSEGDNPTIGLILCTEKNEVVAKYSVLKDRKQIFASKYMLYLPSEEELRREIERERRLIEDRVEASAIQG
jgi:predicted nuclease of restriction endonuclease-like (RecB) superfamily